MSRSNRDVIASVIESIEQFTAGVLGIEEIQAKLQSSLSLLESLPADLAIEIRLAEADLEEIQFTMLLDEQRPAAIFRLDSLRTALESWLEQERA